MKKNQLNEKQFLAEATLWFTHKYHASPKESGIRFIKIWHKPFCGPTVVFALTKEKGEAFIWEKNAIFRSLKCLWLAPISFIIALFIIFSLDTTEARISITAIFCMLLFCAGLFFLYLAKKCKKLEKIHNWDVEIYFP